MYSAASIAVDKGLGFDFSDIAGLVKSALPVGLNIYQNQMQLKQVKALTQSGQPIYSAGQYGQQYGQLPMSQVMQPQPTFGGQYAQPSSGMSTGTMLMLGAGAVGLLLVVKTLMK